MYQREIDILDRAWHFLMIRMRELGFVEKYSLVLDLSNTEISIMHIIDSSPGVTPKDICKQINMPKSTFTHAVKRLTAKGLLYREADEVDRRSYRLFLTEKGRLAQAQHYELEHDVFSELLGQLDPQEAETFGRLLEKAINGLN